MKWIACCLFISLYAGCTDNAKIPKDVIPQLRMQHIMWDIVQADRFVNGFLPRPGDSSFNKAETLKIYDGVFKVHGITREAFFKSYKFYLSRPDITKVMFDSIAAQAERKKAEVYQKPKIDKAKIDSLNKKIIRK